MKYTRHTQIPYTIAQIALLVQWYTRNTNNAAHTQSLALKEGNTSEET